MPLLVALAILGVVVTIGTPLLLRIFVLEAFKIPSGGMLPTVQVGDHLFVRKLGAGPPRRGEVIVFRYPKEPDKDFVKRVIAVGGDTVDIRGRDVYVNGQALRRQPLPGPCAYQDYDDGLGEWKSEPCEAFSETSGDITYATIHTPGGTGHAGALHYPYLVPPKSFFVMGDNRDNSHDSRYWGTVPEELVKGKAWLIWWSRGPAGPRMDRFLQKIHADLLVTPRSTAGLRSRSSR